jgi:hypothetical protein
MCIYNVIIYFTNECRMRYSYFMIAVLFIVLDGNFNVQLNITVIIFLKNVSLGLFKSQNHIWGIQL